MYDGLWTVEFISKIQRYGRGIMVVIQNRLLGGDDGYYYSGKCDIQDKKIRGSVNVIKYDPNSISVFGNISHFQLEFAGDIAENGFEAVGNIAGEPQAQIRIIGIKKEDL